MPLSIPESSSTVSWDLFGPNGLASHLAAMGEYNSGVINTAKNKDHFHVLAY
jgi:hypothetical protein